MEFQKNLIITQFAYFRIFLRDTIVFEVSVCWCSVDVFESCFRLLVTEIEQFTVFGNKVSQPREEDWNM